MITLNREILLRAVDVPFHRSFRGLGRPVITPLEMTFAVTYRCLNLCRTCNSFQKSRAREMSDKEYAALFQNMSYVPFMLTFTGGEPFMRTDFGTIAALACKLLDPPVVQIFSCGDHPERIGRVMRALPGYYKNTQFVIWLSMDGVGSDLEQMRGGVPGAFEAFLNSYRLLRRLSAPNLLVGINILLSKHNVEKGKRLVDVAFSQYPDLVGLDIAFGSEALGVTAIQVAPDADAASEVIDSYLKKLRRLRGRSSVRFFKQLLACRIRTAELNLRSMARTRHCFAGHAALYIDPSGSVKDCPVAARELGDLKENQYRIDRILKSETANRVREQVNVSDCFCTMATPAFSNTFLSPPGYVRLAAASI